MSEFQNPQNQPGIDKRVMIVFAVTMLLLVLAQQFLVKPQQQANQQQRGEELRRLLQPQRGTSLSAAARRCSRRTKPVTAVQAASESTTVVENDLYRITFTNRGGLVKSWILKKYKDEQRPRAGVGARSRPRRNMAIRFRYGAGTSRCARS